MKKNGILNAQLIGELTKLRHLDQLVICDIGFPIPEGKNWVDVSLVAGIPDFMQVLNAVVNELNVQGYTVFDDMKEYNTQIYNEVKALLKVQSSEEVPMDVFLEKAKKAKLFIRTGEARPCSNILLTSASGVQEDADFYEIHFQRNEKET